MSAAPSVLLVGAGRVGMRHLAGLRAAGASVAVVDPQEAARDAAERAGAARSYASIEVALAQEERIDAAVSAEPAEGRLERVALLVERTDALLLEKPLEQSRARTRALADLCDSAVRADCNMNLRVAPLVDDLRGGGPFRLSVTGGAWGLACNGIHYLDLAVFLASAPGRLVFAELEPEPIASPRGASFRDYGGLAAFAFDDGSRLVLDCTGTSSAPAFLTVSTPERLVAADLHADRDVDWRRRPDSDAPVYRYGADYDRTETEGRLGRSIPAITAAWVESLATDDHPLPPVRAALPAHELLFDLLETTGETHFAVT